MWRALIRDARAREFTGCPGGSPFPRDDGEKEREKPETFVFASCRRDARNNGASVSASSRERDVCFFYSPDYTRARVSVCSTRRFVLRDKTLLREASRELVFSHRAPDMQPGAAFPGREEKRARARARYTEEFRQVESSLGAANGGTMSPPPPPRLILPHAVIHPSHHPTDRIEKQREAGGFVRARSRYIVINY